MVHSPLSAEIRNPYLVQSLVSSTRSERTLPHHSEYLLPLNQSAMIPSISSSTSNYQSPSLRYLDSPEKVPLPNVKTLTNIMETPEVRGTSLEKNSSIGGTKLIRYFERQTAALEKLSERIGRQEKEEINERRELKNFSLPTERSFINLENEPKKHREFIEEDSIRMKKVVSEKRPTIKITRNVRRRQTNALEALGQLYLMGKLSNTQTENSILNNRSSILAHIEEEFTDKMKDQQTSILKEKEEEKEQKLEEESEENFGIRESIQPLDSKKERVESKSRRYLQTRRQFLELPRNEQSYNDSKNDIISEKSRVASTSKSKSKIQIPSEEEENDEGEIKPIKSRSYKRERKSKRKTEIPLKLQETKKKIEVKKIKAKKNLKEFLWIMVYSKILIGSVELKAKKRKEKICNVLSNNLQKGLEQAETFLLISGEKFLRDLASENKSLEIFSSKKVLNDKILDIRIGLIAGNLKGLFDKLIVKTSPENLSPYFLKFLTSISEEKGVLPRDFMFDFEIKRLQYTHYGTLKNMTPQRSKMLIGTFILIRVLIYKIILRPWTVFSDVKKAKTNRQ